jgi:LacI family transcriptional regulator
MTSARKIAIIMAQGDPTADLMLAGLCAAAAQRDHVRIRRHFTSVNGPGDLAYLQTWGVEGILCTYVAALAPALTLGVPVVCLRQGNNPQIVFDEEAIGRQAADHLIDQGYRRIAVAVHHNGVWALPRTRGFRAAALARSCAIEVFECPDDDQLQRVITWATNGSPAGIFTLHDLFADQLLDRCAEAGVDVPQQMGVIGADDLTLWCQTAATPLSSVRVPHAQVARRGLEILEAILNGAPVPTVPVIEPPLGVTVRASTDMKAQADPQVACALACIQERAVRGLTVEQVVAASGLARRTLEHRFRAQLKRSIHQQIIATRIAQARRMIESSDLTLGVIAKRTGFANAGHFTTVFRQHTGVTPSSLRSTKA